MSSSTANTSSKGVKRPRNSTSSASTRRTWSEQEERILVDGLKELCANGWRGDNGTLRHGYLLDLERYMNERLPNCGIRAQPHVDSKVRAMKKNYGSIALLKSRSGLGFQYSDGSIIVDCPKAWDDLIKIDPNAKSMNRSKWPLFADWEEIFGKDRATGEFAEGPLDAFEEIQTESQKGLNDMPLGFPVVIVDDDGDAPAEHTGTNHQAAQDESNESGTRQSPNTAQDKPKVSTQSGGTQQTHKQGNNSKASSSKDNEKGKSKRKRTTEDDNENGSFLKGLMEVMKQFADSHDKRMGGLIDKVGDRDRSDMRKNIFSILASSAFENYDSDQRFKASMGICEDVKRMEYFLNASDSDRATMVRVMVNE